MLRRTPTRIINSSNDVAEYETLRFEAKGKGRGGGKKKLGNSEGDVMSSQQKSETKPPKTKKDRLGV